MNLKSTTAKFALIFTLGFLGALSLGVDQSPAGCGYEVKFEESAVHQSAAWALFGQPISSCQPTGISFNIQSTPVSCLQPYHLEGKTHGPSLFQQYFFKDQTGMAYYLTGCVAGGAF